MVKLIASCFSQQEDCADLNKLHHVIQKKRNGFWLLPPCICNSQIAFIIKIGNSSFTISGSRAFQDGSQDQETVDRSNSTFLSPLLAYLTCMGGSEACSPVAPHTHPWGYAPPRKSSEVDDVVDAAALLPWGWWDLATNWNMLLSLNHASLNRMT